MTRLLVQLLLFLLFLGAAVGVFVYSSYLVEPVGGDGPPIRVDIPPGATATEIAVHLKKAGAIRSELAFRLIARLYGAASEMKAGEYRIERSLGVVEIIDYLVAGRAEAHRFVIPEGLTLEQVTNLLVDQRLGTRERFVRAMHRRPARYGLNLRVGRDNLEGYLMPDTYRFASGLTEREIVEALVQNWKRKVWTPNEKAFQASERSVDEIVVMASLIEREARVPEDRPRIASVINNRLEQSMLLQIDATVLYALGKHKSRVTFNDLKVKSPYNTYRRKGLPPGPICSPGLASIQAVLTPDITDYYYYVAQPDGRHVFTRTAGEHGAAIARLQKAARNTHAAPTGR